VNSLLFDRVSNSFKSNTYQHVIEALVSQTYSSRVYYIIFDMSVFRAIYLEGT